MKLTKQTSDAVKILVFCHNHGDSLIKVADMAEELGLRKQMALKICTLLRQEGFLDTVRGPKGGIRLSQQAQTSTLGTIVRRLESSSQANAESDGTHLDVCFDEAMEAFFTVLDGHLLGEIAAAKPKPAKKTASRRKPAARKQARKARPTRPSQRRVQARELAK